jgi:hypothetical protein
MFQNAQPSPNRAVRNVCQCRVHAPKMGGDPGIRFHWHYDKSTVTYVSI